jgi:hypothetical protein
MTVPPNSCDHIEAAVRKLAQTPRGRRFKTLPTVADELFAALGDREQQRHAADQLLAEVIRLLDDHPAGILRNAINAAERKAQGGENGDARTGPERPSVQRKEVYTGPSGDDWSEHPLHSEEAVDTDPLHALDEAKDAIRAIALQDPRKAQLRALFEAAKRLLPLIVDGLLNRDVALEELYDAALPLLARHDREALRHVLGMGLLGVDPLGDEGPDEAQRDARAERQDRHQPESQVTDKPELIVDSGDLPATAQELRRIFAQSGCFFDRGMPVKVVQLVDGSAPGAVRLTTNLTVVEAHRRCRPVKLKDSGPVPTTLPDRVAKMYLDMTGEWSLPPLVGVSTAPLLDADGSVRTADGYDSSTCLWCTNMPKLSLPDRPSRAEGEAALQLLRETFRTFPFADAACRWDPSLGVAVVDHLDKNPGDESAFINGLMTAVCRPSLWLAPGFMVSAARMSGAGTGKGLLVRAICAIAYGVRPRAFTTGNDRHELDKRLVAELIEAAPTLFMDNVNGTMLRSDTLASVLTERPARVRVLGESRMVALNSTAFIAVTGNGITISEDLARRFIVCELDAQCEDPETRPFAPGFLGQIEERRTDLLAAVLTIWRWGRQNIVSNKTGLALGSFETWCGWVRDPLLALGCRDPIERIKDIKAKDPMRRQIAELYIAWWQFHGDRPVKVADLAETIRNLADPQGRGRQYLASYVANLTGTRAAGFVLTRQEAAGKWGAATYALKQTSPPGTSGD